MSERRTPPPALPEMTFLAPSSAPPMVLAPPPEMMTPAAPLASAASPSASVPRTLTSGSVTLTASAPSCAWTAVSNKGFISLTSPAAGTGTAAVTWDVVANPIASILSFAMALRYSFDNLEGGKLVEKAVDRVLVEGYRTGDIMQPGKTKVGTAGMTDAILKALDKLAG